MLNFENHSKISPKAQKSTPETDYTLLTGGMIFQDDLISQGLLGEFEGKGVTTGASATLGVFPKSRAFANIFFQVTAESGTFVTESQEATDLGQARSNSNSNSVAVARIDTLGVVSKQDGHQFSAGLGLFWQQLPFFEAANEGAGDGNLSTKTSIGYNLIFDWHQLTESPYVFSGSLALTPIGANTESIRQVSGVLRLEYRIWDHLSAYFDGRFRYLQIRYTEECSKNRSSQCILPKSVQSSFGGGFGVVLFF